MCLEVCVNKEPLMSNDNKYLMEKFSSFKKVAEEDITVYKRVIFKNGVCYSPYRWFIYSEGTEYQTPLRMSNRCIKVNFAENIYVSYIEINEGFHSYINKYIALTKSQFLKMGDNEESVIEMIIPKGAYYFVSRCGKEMVSNKIYFPPKNTEQ